MNEIKLLRTEQINNFMASFDDLRFVTTDQIKEGLHALLGEEPGVDFEYGVEHVLNEASGKDERKHNLQKIHIFYSYMDTLDQNKEKIGKMSFIVG